MKNEDFKIVRELYPVTQGFWRTRKCPAVDFARETAWAMTETGDVMPLPDAQACNSAAAKKHRIFAMARRKLPFSRTVNAVCTENVWSWNYVMTGDFEIVSPQQFLRRWARTEGSCGVEGLAAAFVVNGLWADFECVVRDQIEALHRSGTGQWSVAEIEAKGVIPLSAWHGVFDSKKAAETVGCAVNVTYARFVSPDRECEQRRIAAAEAQRNLEEKERLAYAAAVNEKTQEAELEAIERARQLASKEFEAKQAELEAAIQKQKIDVEIYEKQRLNEIEVSLIRAKNEEEIRKAEAMRTGDAAAAAATEEKIGSMTRALNEVLARITKASETLAALNVSAERISSWQPPASIAGETARQYANGFDRFRSLLIGLGEQAPNNMAISWEVARISDGYGTRDLLSGCLSDKPSPQGAVVSNAPHRNVLRIGDRMTLKLKSAKSGYLTLFNLGTSGSVVKMFPNAAFGTTANFIEAGREYSLPGELMDPRGLRDGVWSESGPVSKQNGLSERILAILTETPIELKESSLGLETGRAISHSGFAAVEKVVSSLVDLEKGSWSFGLLEATVEN